MNLNNFDGTIGHALIAGTDVSLETTARYQRRGLNLQLPAEAARLSET